MYTAIFSRTYPMKDTAMVLDAVATDGYQGVQVNLSSAGLASLPESLPAGLAARVPETTCDETPCLAGDRVESSQVSFAGPTRAMPL